MTGAAQGAPPRAVAGEPEASAPDSRERKRAGWSLLSPVAVAAAAGAVYCRIPGVPFFFDDLNDIVRRPSIRRLWPPLEELSDGTRILPSRPLPWLSFALDYAVAGLSPAWFHLVNLALHAAAAVALLFLLRELLGWFDDAPAGAGRREAVSFGGALLWAVHPLGSGAVLPAVHRAEIFFALFAFLVLLFSLRSWRGERPGRALLVAVTASVLGMASKETMVAIPPLVLLADRTLASGSFREAIRRNLRLHLSLFATMALPLVFVVAGPSRNFVGKWSGLTAFEYLRTQSAILLRYLRLVLFPDLLAVSWDWKVARTPSSWLPQSLVIVALLALVVRALVLRRKWALLPAGAILALAPTSSVLPLFELAADRRMYVPLAFLLPFALLALLTAFERLRLPAGGARGLFVVLVAGWALLLGTRTFLRVASSRSEEAIWRGNLRVFPDDFISLNNLGRVLRERGDERGAEALILQALATNPQRALDRGQYQAGLGNLLRALVDRKAWGEVERLSRRILELDRDDPRAYWGLGQAAAATGRLELALESRAHAVRLLPEDPGLHFELASALEAMGRYEEAFSEAGESLRRDPGQIEAGVLLAALLEREGRNDDAEEALRVVLAGHPRSVAALQNLGVLLAKRGGTDEAIRLLARAAELEPAAVDVRVNLAAAFHHAGRGREALSAVEEALRLDPADPVALDLAGVLLLEAGDRSGAIERFRRAVQVAPGFGAAKEHLAEAEKGSRSRAR
jgi:tetratricopeptide (TPR) repeat protein